MNIATAFVEIRPDTSQFEGEVKRKATSLGATFAGIFGAAAFGAGLKKSIDAASDLNETVSKSRQLFGAAGRDMEAMADKAAKTMGLSKRAYLDAAAGLKGLLDNLGLADEQSVEWSKSLVALGADLASFYNTSTEDAAQAIASALRGEQEPIRRYNVNINEAAIKTKAFEMGLYAGKGAIDSSAKAQAILALITDQTTNAQGDFARTADGVANSQRVAAAETENAAASMGQSLLPIYQRAVEMVGWLAEGFGALPAPLQMATIGLLGVVALAGPMKSLASAVSGAVDAVKGMSITAGGSLAALGALAAVAAVVAVAYVAFRDEETVVEAATRKMTKSVTDAAGALDVTTVATQTATAATEQYAASIYKAIEAETRDKFSKPRMIQALNDTHVSMGRVTMASHDAATALALLADIEGKAAAAGIELDLAAETSATQGLSDYGNSLWLVGHNAFVMAEATKASTHELVNAALAGDVASIAALKAGGNWGLLSSRQQYAAQATLDAAEGMEAAGEAAGNLSDEITKLSDDYATLLGQLDNRDAYRNMEDGIDSVREAALALFDASDPRPLEERQRAYQQALDDSTRDLLSWADTLAAKVPEEQVTKVRTLIDQGSYDYARAMLRALELGNTLTFEFNVNGFAGQRVAGVTRGPMQSFDVGGYIDRDQVAQVHRNEVVLPLGNPARVAALLGDPRVAPAVAAANGSAPAGGPGGLHIGTLNVGNGRDLPDAQSMLERTMWRVSFG